MISRFGGLRCWARGGLFNGPKLLFAAMTLFATIARPWIALAANAAPIEITARHADELLAKLPADDPWEKAPDGSTLAWGESHLLNALVDLYEWTGDSKYLVVVARRGIRLLTHRDDRRGVVDGSGQSRPAWSMASKYVVADGQIVNGAGQPVIALRSTPSAYNNLTKVEVQLSGAAAAERFSLRITNSQFKREERFEDLSLEPADARYVETIVNAPNQTHSAKAGRFTDHSSLLRATVVMRGSAVLVPQTFTLRPIPLAYMGYLGVIYHPLLRFAEIVKADQQLSALTPAADRFVQAAEESYADASKRLWREGPNPGEGYYICCEKGESFPYDNVGEPFNYLGRHTAAQLALHRLTGKLEYRERAAKMARLFKNRLKHDVVRDLYTWNYWFEPVTTTGWTPANSPSLNIPNLSPAAAIEDVSHGVLDIALVVSAHRAGVVFDDSDLQRCANTLLVNVLNPARTTVRRRVDGSAGEFPAYLPALAGWLDLAVANPAVYHEINRTVQQSGTDHLQLIAALLKWQKRLPP
jgi:hypothetical protein